MSISIAPVTSIEECREIEWLQEEIWESSQLEVAPDHLVWTIAKEGGMVLLARNEQDDPIGFAYGILGLTADKQLKLASHQAGVLAQYHDQNIGSQLKLAQRDLALKAGLELITWTFDPLQGRNANLNLRKLGAVCNTYLPNLYGTMRDELNQGLPSDRFRVDWWIGSPWVATRLAGNSPIEEMLADLPIANHSVLNDENVLLPPSEIILAETSYVLVEFPRDIGHIKMVAPALALQWRLHQREIFQTAFQAGYIVVDLVARVDRNCYILQKNWQRK